MGQVFVNIKPGDDVESLRVYADSRFAILPDFFADDIVIDAMQLPAEIVELPSEHFLIQPIANRDAMLISVCNTSEQDMKVYLAGGDEERRITYSDIFFWERRGNMDLRN